MKRDILDHFQGKENVTHIVSDNGTESYLTQSRSFGDEAYALGATKLNTVENEKKHVLFLFNSEDKEVGRYYLGKKLQGKTPSELVALKDSLAFFETWNPESKSWVPCVGLSSNAPDTKTSLRKITISKPIINTRTSDNASDIKASLKKHELSLMLFDKNSVFNFYSTSDNSLQWGYKKDGSFFNNDVAIFGLAAYLWIIDKLNKEDLCWLLDFLNKRSMSMWKNLQISPEKLISEIKYNVSSFRLEDKQYNELKREIQFAWIDLQSFIMFINYSSYNMGDISGRRVLRLQSCTSYDDIATLICSDMGLTRSNDNQVSNSNQDVELPF